MPWGKDYTDWLENGEVDLERGNTLHTEQHGVRRSHTLLL